MDDTRRLSPTIYSIATDGGVHRRCTPEVPAGAMDWLGEPPSARYAARYEADRGIVMRAELARLTSEHSLAEGSRRAALAEEMATLHVAIGGGQ